MVVIVGIVVHVGHCRKYYKVILLKCCITIDIGRYTGYAERVAVGIPVLPRYMAVYRGSTYTAVHCIFIVPRKRGIYYIS